MARFKATITGSHSEKADKWIRETVEQVAAQLKQLGVFELSVEFGDGEEEEAPKKKPAAKKAAAKKAAKK